MQPAKGSWGYQGSCSLADRRPHVCAAGGQSIQVAAQKPETNGPLTVLEIKPDFYMIAGPAAMSPFTSGGMASVTDAGHADTAETLLAAIRRFTSRPIRPRHQHQRRLRSCRRQRGVVGGGRIDSPGWHSQVGIIDPQHAAILAEESVPTRMSAPTGQQAPFPPAALPTIRPGRLRRTSRKLVLSGEAIQVMHQPAAHSDGDSLVLPTVRRVDNRRCLRRHPLPLIDVARGGSIQGVLLA